MTYAVLLYGDTPNPRGLPPGWPARVQPGESRPAPWQSMTRAQLAQQIADNQAAYDAWLAAQPPPLPPASTLTAVDGSAWVLNALGRPEKQ